MTAEPYPKSEREVKINDICEKISNLPDGEKKSELQRELLQHIEGENYFSSEEKTKILLLNGPPRSGKDTVAEFAMDYLGKRGERYRFAAPLKNSIHSMFGLNGVHEEHLTHVKDTPSEKFAGKTPRELYIWLSEEVVKPKFGHDFWSRIAVTTIASMKKPVIVVSDCGFVEEARVLIDAFGKENVAIAYLKRDGCDFKKDSRSYIDGVDCEKFTIENNGTVHELYNNVVEVLKLFAGSEDAK